MFAGVLPPERIHLPPLGDSFCKACVNSRWGVLWESVMGVIARKAVPEMNNAPPDMAARRTKGLFLKTLRLQWGDRREQRICGPAMPSGYASDTKIKSCDRLGDLLCFEPCQETRWGRQRLQWPWTMGCPLFRIVRSRMRMESARTETWGNSGVALRCSDTSG